MDTGILTVFAAAIPLSAALMIWIDAGSIFERHHSHHDTYVVARTFSWTLMFAMIFMGSLGILLGWLCLVGVFNASAPVVLGFFDAFLGVSMGFWLILRRYKVVTYDERMEVTPFFGRMTTILYKDISAMEWVPSLLMPSSRNIRVFVGHRRRALLWAGLDLDQILIRVNRFDAIDNLSAPY